MTVSLISLVVEMDLVGPVEGLPVPLDRGGSSRDPDLTLLSFDVIDDLSGDDHPTESGLLLLIVGVVVEQADLVLVHVPPIHPSDPIPLILDDGEWIAL